MRIWTRCAARTTLRRRRPALRRGGGFQFQPRVWRSLLPKPEDDQPASGKSQASRSRSHQEAASKDIEVGIYYLETKNWKASSFALRVGAGAGPGESRGLLGIWPRQTAIWAIWPTPARTTRRCRVRSRQPPRQRGAQGAERAGDCQRKESRREPERSEVDAQSIAAHCSC
jgi:hypothetical protein